MLHTGNCFFLWPCHSSNNHPTRWSTTRPPASRYGEPGYRHALCNSDGNRIPLNQRLPSDVLELRMPARATPYNSYYTSGQRTAPFRTHYEKRIKVIWLFTYALNTFHNFFYLFIHFLLIIYFLLNIAEDIDSIKQPVV